MENICEHCGKNLSDSIYNEDRTMKSCPSCSANNGSCHVFHSYPEEYGTTKKRASSNFPEGPQSYCVKCRGNNPPNGGILCSDME